MAEVLHASGRSCFPFQLADSKHPLTSLCPHVSVDKWGVTLYELENRETGLKSLSLWGNGFLVHEINEQAEWFVKNNCFIGPPPAVWADSHDVEEIQNIISD